MTKKLNPQVALSTLLDRNVYDSMKELLDITGKSVMGHMSSETFLKNYKNSRVDKKLAEEYFSITP